MNEKLLSFGDAISAMESGKIVCRDGWNGKGMWLFMQLGNTVPSIQIPFFKSFPDSVKQKLYRIGEDVVFAPNIVMKTAQGTIQAGWHPSMPDMFAKDWRIVA